PHPPPSPSAARRQSRSSRAGDRRRGSSPPARAGSSCRRSSVFLPERGWSRNQTLPESADDRRATQLHHVRGRHRRRRNLAILSCAGEDRQMTISRKARQLANVLENVAVLL